MLGLLEMPKVASMGHNSVLRLMRRPLLLAAAAAADAAAALVAASGGLS